MADDPKDIVVVTEDDKRAEPVEPETDELKVGQWYWTKTTNYKGVETEWLGCIVHLGSNYAEISDTDEGQVRVHFDDFDETCRFEPNPEAYIDDRIQHYRGEVHRLMGRVQEVTARLGVGPSPMLGSGGETQALATINSNQDFGTYSKDLVKAKEDLLPDLFKKIEEANRNLARWMTAKVIPLKAQARGMREVIKKIDDRIFSVELYAGLTEQVERIAEGEPAPPARRLSPAARGIGSPNESHAPSRTSMPSMRGSPAPRISSACCRSPAAS